jgi:hypothetical protein
LGLGSVFVTASIQEGGTGENSLIWGSSEVFEDPSAVKAELAVKANPTTGTFVIGVRLLEATTAYEVKLVWYAIRHRDHTPQQERKILLDCSAKSLHQKESSYFTVKFVNLPPCDLHWTVDSENGGTINESGCYTAPNHPGVFKITATCTEEKNISASAYIVVKP